MMLAHAASVTRRLRSALAALFLLGVSVTSTGCQGCASPGSSTRGDAAPTGDASDASMGLADDAAVVDAAEQARDTHAFACAPGMRECADRVVRSCTVEGQWVDEKTCPEFCSAAKCVQVPSVRFVAIGDTGEPTEHMAAVASAIARKCQSEGCDFVALLGDNIYPSGAASADDPIFDQKFEKPFAAVEVPFYVALGNHDYGNNGVPVEFHRGQHQVDYSMRSLKWRMPAAHYHFTKGPAEFFVVDSTLQNYGRDEQQKVDVAAWIAGSTAPWKIVLGHHPYLSNGQHGNAGSYPGPLQPNGAGVKAFFEEILCGKMDLALSGHDHNRQWIKTTCNGTELIVSGAGGYSQYAVTGRNPYYFESSDFGFVYIAIEGKTLKGEILNNAGEVQFSRTLTKP
jgi:hypothetical protein